MSAVAAQAYLPLTEVAPFNPHYDVLILVAALVIGYLYAVRRIGIYQVAQGTPPVTARQMAWFFGGVAALFVAAWWPIHDLAEESMFTFHMIEHLIIGLVVPPMLLLGTPRWLAELIGGSPRVLPIVKRLSRPIPAFFFYSLILVGIHWPAVNELMVTSDAAHFLIHAVFFTSAMFMWMPVVSPLPDVPRIAPPARAFYLFLHSIIPTVPASFLTFGTTPIYDIYETFPKLWGFDTITDQTVAGLIMKLVGGLYLWAIIAVIWFRWYNEEQRWEAREKELRGRA
jgi:putative membrane protein